MFFKMKYFDRITAMIISAAIIISCMGGCMEKADNDWQSAEQLREQLYHASLETDNEVELSGSVKGEITLPYSASDKMNPFTCQSTLTQNICYLLYDRLVQLDPDFEPLYVLAKKVEIEHTLVKVQIRSGIVFSDGSPLTAEDVNYSYFMAKKTKGSIYASKLADVTNCSVDGMTITFLMAHENINAYRILDFPIVHYDPTANANLPPIGSGRYKFAKMSDGNTLNTSLLIKNKRWYEPDQVKINSISLVELPTVESIVHSIEIGTVSYMYTDMRDGTPTKVNADYQKVDLNNLVYLGVNTNVSSLADENVRRAMSYAISTNQVSYAGFGGMAYSATGPFTPNWKTAAQYQHGNGRAKLSDAKKSLELSGYTEGSGGIRQDQTGQRLDFNLLVNKNNSRHMAAAESVKNQLAAIGINVEITGVTAAGLKKRIEEGNYHIYLAEYAIADDMDIGPLFTPGSGLYTGPKPYECIQRYTAYTHGLEDIESFISAFENELPFIPLCYRSGIIVYERSLEGVGRVSENQPFYNMQEWYVEKKES